MTMRVVVPADVASSSTPPCDSVAVSLENRMTSCAGGSRSSCSGCERSTPMPWTRRLTAADSPTRSSCHPVNTVRVVKTMRGCMNSQNISSLMLFPPPPSPPSPPTPSKSPSSCFGVRSPSPSALRARRNSAMLIAPLPSLSK